MTPGPYMSLLPAFLPLPATRCSPPVPYLARGATCWATGGPPGGRGSGTSLILSVLCESNCVHAFSCICLLLFSLGVLSQAARCFVIQVSLTPQEIQKFATRYDSGHPLHSPSGF